PKAGTPMQFLGLISKDDYQRRIRLIRKELPRKYFRVEALSHNIAYVQALLSLGGVEIADALVKYVINGFNISDFRTLLTSLNIDPNYVFKFKSTSEALPWEFIDLGINISKMYENIMSCLNQ
ncbi:MAG: hypothetical protein QXK28_06570, partial [Sulfolobales archaeon]